MRLGRQAVVALAVVSASAHLNRAETPVEGQSAAVAAGPAVAAEGRPGSDRPVQSRRELAEAAVSALRATRSGPGARCRASLPRAPNRVFLLMRGELPELARPTEVPYPSVGPSLSFPGVPDAVPQRLGRPVSSPGNSGSDGWNGWKGKLGVDARWEHCLFVVDAQGNIVEEWTQWDEIFSRPHSVAINPYDPQKHVWVVDDRQHAVYKFTNDGKQLVQTLGVRGVPGTDADALQSSDVPRLAARQHAVRGRRLRQHARRQVRQGRQIPDGLGREGHAAERHPARAPSTPSTASPSIRTRGGSTSRIAPARRIQVFDENGVPSTSSAPARLLSPPDSQRPQTSSGTARTSGSPILPPTE